METRSTIKIAKILSWIVLLFFTWLMVRITVPYLSLAPDVKFLRIKQWVIENDVWRIAFFTHVFSSIFLLMAGFTQFHSPFKSRYKTLHRQAGKMYVFIILFISGPAGLIMAVYANGGWKSQLAFAVLSVLWLWTTARAWRAARERNFMDHGAWMVRSYALTLSALTLRAWKFLIALSFQLPPMDIYMIVAWLGWVPNMVLAEWLLRRHFLRKAT